MSRDDTSPPTGTHTVLLAEWHAAKVARDFHRATGPRFQNLDAMIAALKMRWIKEIAVKIGPASPSHKETT